MAIANQFQAPANSPKANAEILLESGTNELEVLVFGMANEQFGVNVAKVREVILPVTPTASPNQHPSVLGMFNLRGGVLPLVDLHKYFELTPGHDANNQRIIVTEFNGQRTGFLVDSVEQIYRMSWSGMRAVPDTHSETNFCLTGITEINDRLVLMLDFESIVDHINMEDQLHVEVVENKLGVDRATPHVMIVEDSYFIRNLMQTTLTRSGYTNLSVADNGATAWQLLEQSVNDPQQRPVDLVVADIEMPQVDGLHLTRKIKEHPTLGHIPVLLFSSLITNDTRHKGQQVGADDQIAKPQLPELVQIVDGWIDRTRPAA